MSKIYAVTIKAQSVTQVLVSTNAFRGDTFEDVYKKAYEDARKQYPTDTHSGHWVGFAEIPQNWILEAAEQINQAKGG